MGVNSKTWYYAGEGLHEWIGPLTREALNEAHRSGVIEDHTFVTNAQNRRSLGPSGSGVPFSMLPVLDVGFTPPVAQFLADREHSSITVLSGPNNSGKTLLLKQLYLAFGYQSHFISCNRFSHVDVLGSRQIEAYEHRRYFDSFNQQYHATRMNSDDNQVNLEQIITSLKDNQRAELFRLCTDLLGNKFSLLRVDEENQFSPFYVDMDGENLRYGSSGTRLLLTLLGTLLDRRFSVLLIDEPEIGLSPRIQTVLSQFLYDDARRVEFCGHLRKVFVVTHSHLFLDRMNLGNNHIITKNGNDVTIQRLATIADFHRLQFNMLGNDLEAIFMPAAIVIVEGVSDHIFLSRVIQLKIPDRKVAVVCANGEGAVRSKLHFFRETFGDLRSSVYHNRVFVVLDHQISVKLPKIEQDGVLKENVFVLAQNGIEFYYPNSLVAAAYRTSEAEVAGWKFENDEVVFNGIRQSKKQLSEFVSSRLTATAELHAEILAIISKIEEATK